MNTIKRVFVEKKCNYNVAGKQLLDDLKQNLQIDKLENVKIYHRYDVAGISEDEYKRACHTIFSEPTIDELHEEDIILEEDEKAFAVEYLPGQYDQRADSAEQCIQILNSDEEVTVRCAKVIVCKGSLTNEDIDKVKKYCINPVDSREADMVKPETLEINYEVPTEVEYINGFITKDENEIENLIKELGLAMSKEDLIFTRDYFKDEEKRDPSITEIRVLDTYWSDHCRHTTFATKIEDVDIKDGKYNKPVKKAFVKYLDARKEVYAEKKRDINLMDIALMGMKQLKKQGKAQDLEVSEEINACSIVVPVDVNGVEEEWLVMFKNETHNHPTEIEPFGGAATCLGGAIRDPLSGRSYVYQAMRITGSGDPTTKIEDTIPGKLPQRKIAKQSAHGYSSYGNQIGLATGQVVEIYDEKYVAKHMELGAVIAAAPRENVIRETSDPGDIIVLLGGRTGRDGCGGATGSSKEHTEESIHTCGAEVQKGNPPTERKIQRLFRNKKVSQMIKKCNDFGAGGVSVAIGELADGLIINLDKVLKKYAGLDGTELSISESQERMAVVLDPKDVDEFIKYSEEENLEAVVVAKVTEEKRLVIKWNEKDIVNVSRKFLDTNGATQKIKVSVDAPRYDYEFFKSNFDKNKGITKSFIDIVSDLNVCSQKGLVEMFDSSIGAGSVLMPFGGKTQLTPTQSMVAKIPVLSGDTTTGTIMSHGYNPKLSTWSPFHGAVYAVVESVAKVVATGGSCEKIRFTFQEYFERLNKDYSKWGKPFSSLLGAYFAQEQLGLPSIGGKDSMSGTFNEINVPPTLVSFAVDVVNVEDVISPEFKQINSKIVYIPLKRNEELLPDFDELKVIYKKVTNLINEKNIISASAITSGGIAEAVSKMSLGNVIGVNFNKDFKEEELFVPDYGSFVVEIPDDQNIQTLFSDMEYKVIGTTNESGIFNFANNEQVTVEEIAKAWQAPLEKVYKTKTKAIDEKIEISNYETKITYVNKNKVVKPRVFIPTFPGTNCEYDSAKRFSIAGANPEIFVFKNIKPKDIEESIDAMVKQINQSQIVMIPGGFSAGDEPDGSGKFIATVFRNQRVKEAVMNLLNNRDGLMLGICNGFQALIKLGLVPYGEIKDIDESCPTLTYNTIGRHVSCMVDTKIVSNKSPWLANVGVGDIHSIPVSHGEGRFVANENMVKELVKNGQVATQYVDLAGNPTYDIKYNPNGSVMAIEGITSPDGRVFGKMGHSERIGKNIAKNIIGDKDQKIFEAGVHYFTK